MMFFKSPGYVPNNQRYDPNLMSMHDQMIYENLRVILHSTARQQRFESGWAPRGSITTSAYHNNNNARNSGGIMARLRASVGKSDYVRNQNQDVNSSHQQKISFFNRNQSRDGALTSYSYRNLQQSQYGTSEAGGDGLVYFVETEAEEIYQVADHSEQFVFEDHPSQVDKKRSSTNDDIGNNESEPLSLSRRHASQANNLNEPLSSGGLGGCQASTSKENVTGN